MHKAITHSNVEPEKRRKERKDECIREISIFLSFPFTTRPSNHGVSCDVLLRSIICPKPIKY